MLHEGGHAIHSFLAHPLELNGFKEYPMEIAEVANMSMELMTMEEWDSFFQVKKTCDGPKEHQLEQVITIFPWIAIIDKFQHWVYEHPSPTTSVRMLGKYSERFQDDVVDYSGLEHIAVISGKPNCIFFEVPFYYIEYGIAQLGAIGMWMQFRQNKQKALDNHCKAPALGGTQTLPLSLRSRRAAIRFSARNASRY